MLVINCEESVRRFSRTKKSFPKPETYKLYVFGMVLCNVHYYECMKSFPKPETYKLYVFGMVLCNVHYYECMKLLTVYLKKYKKNKLS